MSVKNIKEFDLKHIREQQLQLKLCPFKSDFIPPLNHLLVWEAEITSAKNIAMDKFFIASTEYGNIGLSTIKIFITLHSIRNVKTSVTQEIDWFNQALLKPKSVGAYPSTAFINKITLSH